MQSLRSCLSVGAGFGPRYVKVVEMAREQRTCFVVTALLACLENGCQCIESVKMLVG